MVDEIRFLPYGRQSISEQDIEAVAQVLRSDFLTTGPAVAHFENAVAQRLGCDFVVACSSGTAALHIALLAAGIGETDAVIVPSLTFMATANCVRLVGAEVVFADCDPTNGVMGCDHARAALAKARAAGLSVRAIMPVHLNGQSTSLPDLLEWADGEGLMVIEDAAHAFGSAYQTPEGETVQIGEGRHSAMTCFSFHPVKTIAMGEGGAVSTADPELADRLRLMRNHGMTADHRLQQNPGLNYRATDMQCALGASQLSRIDQFIKRRRDLVQRYDDLLGPLDEAVHPIKKIDQGLAAWHLYPVLIDFNSIGQTRDDLRAKLKAAGIGTQVHYAPVHLQPFYRDRYGLSSLEGVETYASQCLSLPLFPAMADSDPARVVDALKTALAI